MFLKLNFYEKEKGKWYIKSHDLEGKEKIVYNEKTKKSAPEEIVRQLFLFELTDYYEYPVNRIKTEKEVEFGREIHKKRADIVVYQKDNITPWLIAEVKGPNEKLNIQQLKSYLNAEGSPIGVGINGKEKTILYRPYPRKFDDTLPDIPFAYEKDVDDVFKRNWTLEKLEEINYEKQFNLRAIIETLEELVLANSGVESFTEIFKMIYAKLYDEFEAKNRKNHMLKFRKYKDHTITFEEISRLFEAAKNEWKDVFEPTDRIKLTSEHLSVCVGELEKVKLFGANLRIIDEAFEYLVPEVSKSKKGQYFTPRVIIDCAVKMLNPGRKEYIVDPACGSAGFLVHSMEFVWRKYNMHDFQSKLSYAGKYVWGIDFDERSAKISRAIMLIAGDGKTHIYKENSLEYTKWNGKIKTDLQEERLNNNKNYHELLFNILMTNPPFAGDIKENHLMSLYSIINMKKSKVSRHILFMERALNMIKKGGRLAIVLPQGIFNNTNEKYIREFIMKRARILAVVGLDGTSFKPHTGTKTSLLFLRRWGDDEIDDGGNPKMDDYPIFFATSKVPFKDNSGNYIFIEKSKGIYKTDLFDIADAFITWGKKQLKNGDNHFDFLEGA